MTSPPAHGPHRDRTERALMLVVIAAGLAVTATFLTVAIRRLLFPYEIEWLESEILQHVHRARHGLSLYTAPTAEFAPTIYPPLYAWLSALVARAVGVSLLAPRLVSTLATLATALLAGYTARRLGRSPIAGFAAFALVLAAYVPCGTVQDLARLDALWVLFLLAATAVAARAALRRSLPLTVAAAGLFAVAAATKQPAALFAVAIAAAVALAHRSIKLGTLLVGLAGLLSVAFYGALHVGTSGWSTTYLIELPLRVPRRPAAFLHFFRDDLLGNATPAIALLAVWFLLGRARRPEGALPAVWWAGLGAAFLATLSMRTLQGGAENTLLPVFVFGAVLAAAVAGRLLTGGGREARLAVLVALALQLGRLAYAPTSLSPSAEDRARGDRLVAWLRSLPGDVWVASHTSYAFLAGKPFFVHRDPLLDILYTDAPFFPADLLERLRSGGFSAVVSDGPFIEEHLEQALALGYVVERTLADPPRPLVGYRTTPRLIWRPRADRARGPSGPP